VDQVYQEAAKEVYQEAAKAIIEQDQHLHIWKYLNIGPEAREGDALASWASYIGTQNILFGLKAVPFLKEVCKTKQRIRLLGDSLIVSGFIVDQIAHVSGNLSKRNVRWEVITFSGGRLKDLDVAAQTSLWRALITFDPHSHDYNAFEKRFSNLITQWDDAEHASEHVSHFEEFINHDLRLEHGLWRSGYNLGRNLFRTNRGLFGIGPAGKNESWKTGEQAVEVGDRFAIVAGALTPVILRPHHDQANDDEWFSVVGMAYVGCLEGAECFKDRKVLDFEPLTIR